MIINIDIDGQIIQQDITQTSNEQYETAKQIKELKEWFDEFYTIHEQQYRRLHTLGDTTAYAKLLGLYNEAEQKRALIQELEVKLEND